MTKVGLYAIGKSTTLESNKSLVQTGVIGNVLTDAGLQLAREKDFVVYTTKCSMKCSE